VESRDQWAADVSYDKDVQEYFEQESKESVRKPRTRLEYPLVLETCFLRDPVCLEVLARLQLLELPDGKGFGEVSTCEYAPSSNTSLPYFQHAI